MSTSGDVQYMGGYQDACGGYHEYIGVFNINQRLLPSLFYSPLPPPPFTDNSTFRGLGID